MHKLDMIGSGWMRSNGGLSWAMANQWQIKQNQNVLGPFADSQLREMAAAGQVNRKTPIRVDANSIWIPAGRFVGLFPDDPSDGEVSTNDSLVLQPSVESQSAGEMSANWYYADDNKRKGPFTESQMRELVESGRIGQDDVIWRPGLKNWVPATRFLKSIPKRSQDSDGSPQPVVTDDDADERHVLVDTYALVANLRQAGLTGIIPLRAWLRDRPLTLVWVQLLVFLFSCPLLLVQYYAKRHAPIEEAAWALSIYFAIIEAAILFRCVRPQPIGIGRTLVVWLSSGLLSIGAVLLLSEIGSWLPFARDAFDAVNSPNLLLRLIGYSLAVGLIEEFAKALMPLLIAGFSSKSMTPNTGAFLGCLSGLSFGSTEAVMYSVGYAVEGMDTGDYIIVQVLRWISLPLLHGIWSGIFGYFIFLARKTKGSRGSMIFLGLALASFLHGSYDAFVDDMEYFWAGATVAMVSLFLFIGYIRGDTAVENSKGT